MKITTVLLLLCCAFVLQAEVMVFDRGLPVANLNNAAGANRSNVAWGDYTPYGTPSYNWAVGDDFNLGLAGTFHVTDLRVWLVGINGKPLSEMWSDLTLFLGGTAAGSITAVTPVGTVVTEVSYANSETYQGSSGNFIKIHQVDFLLDWWINGNSTYTFFVGGTPTQTNIDAYGTGVSPFLSASNSARSGSTQQGADNLFREIGYNGSGVVQYSGTWDSSGACGNSNICGGWDKSSDINVQVFVPEPSVIMMLGAFAGLLGFGAFARKRRA